MVSFDHVCNARDVKYDQTADFPGYLTDAVRATGSRSDHRGEIRR